MTPKKMGKKKAVTREPTISFVPGVANNLHATIFRYNPSMDFVPRTHTYTMEKKEGESVWELLSRIKHRHDGSLTFRGNCGNGACGGCGIKVNGKPTLACTTQVASSLDAHNTMRIDPLDEKSVKKDLAQDETLFFAQFLAVKPWIQLRSNEHVRQHKMSLQELERLDRAPNCHMCQLCNTAARTDLEKELGPAAFVKGYRYARDMRDGDVTRIKLLQSHFPVHYALKSANLCPRDIMPGEKMEWIKKQKIGKSTERSK
ncbi:MAG: hypothetical protein IPJ89_01535 [Candidatus Iainarchaeum archaeon]|uniref:2Fe-2S ferredoxin-type domain-containing protein n=1 Tax=Candidatus Iainarchaeum sp. TaxID=3101447 RepID=A0A7T9DKF9_9ARCH|nr:MAG: hypothetical protein IPJ89_01535 [Candidatus Diapherotrites archaeon]